MKKVDSKQPTRILPKNRFLELTFDPARGGRCSRLQTRATGEQVIGDEDVSGMFLDHWAKYAWPSRLMHLPYRYQLVKEGKRRCGVWPGQVPEPHSRQEMRQPDIDSVTGGVEGWELALDFTGGRGLLQIGQSHARDTGCSQVEILQLGQHFQVHQPGVGDFSATKIDLVNLSIFIPVDRATKFLQHGNGVHVRSRC